MAGREVNLRKRILLAVLMVVAFVWLCLCCRGEKGSGTSKGDEDVLPPQKAEDVERWWMEK